MTFCNQLGTDHDIYLVIRDLLEFCFKFLLGSDFITVNAGDSSGWKGLFQGVLNALRAEPQIKQRGIAFWACWDTGFYFSAMMTTEFLAGLMVNKVGVAAFTLGLPAATAALYNGCVAAPIDIKDCLLLIFDGRFNMAD